MPAWIISLVVGFVLRQIAKFSESTDWQKVKADVFTRIHAIVPAWLASGIDEIVGQAIDVLAAALASTDDLSAIANKLVSGDIQGGLALLIELVQKLVHLPSQYVVLEALQKMQSAAPATEQAAPAADEAVV